MKKQKRHWFAIVMLLIAIMVLSVAKATDRLLQIWQVDGKIVTINLNDEPVTTYVDGNLVITTTKVTITYPLEQVTRYTYIEDEAVSEGDGVPNGIRSVLLGDNESLIFKGLKSNTEIRLYSTSGRLVQALKANDGNDVAVSISQLPVGVYLVKVNGVTYKISKR